MRTNSSAMAVHSSYGTWIERTRFPQQLFAMAMLLAILLALVLFWPIPQLGFTVDRETGIVTEVTTTSPAGRAGLTVSDRIVRIYTYAWEDVDRQLMLFPLSWETMRAVPVRIDRHGIMLDINLQAEAPLLLDQIEKIVGFLLGLICWIVGYILGLVRRNHATRPTAIAYFWMGLGGILGSYTLVSYGSYPIKALLLWLLLTLVTPYSVYTHIWFPVRPVTMVQARYARRYLTVTLIGLQCILLAATAIWHPTLTVWIDAMVQIVPTALVLAFVASSVVLWHAYRLSTIAHVQRQIRIVLFACLLTAACWVFLRVLPTLIQQDLFLPNYAIDAISCLVPIAYLACGIIPDLNRLDRVLQRISLYLAAAALLGGVLFAIMSQMRLSGLERAIWASLAGIMLYRPSYILVHSTVRRLWPHEPSYTLLDSAATQLAGTLDINEQVCALCSGIESAFGVPQIACYINPGTQSTDLILAYAAGLQLPKTLVGGMLIDRLSKLPSPTSARTLYQNVTAEGLNECEIELLHQPGIELWCSIRHAQGQLLGLLLIGMRANLDPYRSEDMRELRRLVESAVLAFTNSNAYTVLAKSEETIRRLYKRYQQIQLTTASAIAREIHDEVINLTLTLNIEALEQVLIQVTDPAIQQNIELVLEGEHTAARFLRLVCEKLYPMGLNDPMGLPIVIERHVSRIEKLWHGSCQFVIAHSPCPITTNAQWHAQRVVREAIINAVKHAHASEILIVLAYPTESDPFVRLSICDNGSSPMIIPPEQTSFGIRFMHESAEALEGTIVFLNPPKGGTEVVFAFPPQSEELFS